MRHRARVRPDARRPREEIGELAARGAEQARQRNRREVERPRRADQRVGRDQVLLGLPQVGPAREQFRRQARRHGGQREVVEFAVAR